MTVVRQGKGTKKKRTELELFCTALMFFFQWMKTENKNCLLFNNKVH